MAVPKSSTAPFGLKKDGTPKKGPGGRPAKGGAGRRSPPRRRPAPRPKAPAVEAPTPAASEPVSTVEPSAPETPAPPAEVANPFAGEALPPPSQREGARIIDPPPPPAPEPAAAPSAPPPEPDENGRIPLGEDAAAQYVDMAFEVRDMVGGWVITQQKQWKLFPSEFQAVLQEAEKLSEPERRVLRPGLIKRLAKTKLTENEIFFGTWAVIEAKHLYTVYAMGQQYFAAQKNAQGSSEEAKA